MVRVEVRDKTRREVERGTERLLFSVWEEGKGTSDEEEEEVGDEGVVAMVVHEVEEA